MLNRLPSKMLCQAQAARTKPLNSPFLRGESALFRRRISYWSNGSLALASFLEKAQVVDPLSPIKTPGCCVPLAKK